MNPTTAPPWAEQPEFVREKFAAWMDPDHTGSPPRRGGPGVEPPLHLLIGRTMARAHDRSQTPLQPQICQVAAQLLRLIAIDVTCHQVIGKPHTITHDDAGWHTSYDAGHPTNESIRLAAGGPHPNPACYPGWTMRRLAGVCEGSGALAVFFSLVGTVAIFPAWLGHRQVDDSVDLGQRQHGRRVLAWLHPDCHRRADEQGRQTSAAYQSTAVTDPNWYDLLPRRQLDLGPLDKSVHNRLPRIRPHNPQTEKANA